VLSGVFFFFTYFYQAQNKTQQWLSSSVIFAIRETCLYDTNLLVPLFPIVPRRFSFVVAFGLMGKHEIDLHFTAFLFFRIRFPELRFQSFRAICFIFVALE